jgi:hypothetical protein
MAGENVARMESADANATPMYEQQGHHHLQGRLHRDRSSKMSLTVRYITSSFGAPMPLAAVQP